MFKGSPLPYLINSGCVGCVGVGDEIHMGAVHSVMVSLQQHHPHLFDELGGWQQATCQMVSPQHFRMCVHQDGQGGIIAV